MIFKTLNCNVILRFFPRDHNSYFNLNLLLELSLGQPRPENKNVVQQQPQPALNNFASSQSGYAEQRNYFNKNTGPSQFATPEDLLQLHQFPAAGSTDIKQYFANINIQNATYPPTSMWSKL